MLRSGIINPHVLSLVARIRHTNALVIADWAFPAWPGVETVDLSLIAGIPTVPQVLGAILANWQCETAYMAEEFRTHNPPQIQELFTLALRGVPVHFEPHVEFKRRVPGALGLIRTGDATVYSNMVLISG
ncbi:MAG: RbsD/FucU family protein [Verrucomicrobiales bacterium]|nr:RbsD/FucU family protein [Verrucomicrobiales bacterium]